jgi:hypothetical protein
MHSMKISVFRLDINGLLRVDGCGVRLQVFDEGGDLALDLLREHNMTGDKDVTGNKEWDMLDCVVAILCAAVAVAKQQDLPQLHRSFTA